MKGKVYLIGIGLLLLFISIGAVSANDNVTDDVSLDEESLLTGIDETPVAEINESSPTIQDSHIEVKDVKTYYKEKSTLVSYLKDDKNQSISNKKVSIFINNKGYDRITDNVGKVVLKLNLKPGTYTAKIMFAGDEDYSGCSADAVVKVNKASLLLSTKNYKTYFESGFYFKAKVTNKVTKNPVEGIKVAFKVYKNNKCKTYWATTDADGIAKLKKNLNVGSYKIVTSIKKSKNLKSKKSKAALTIKETAEMGCTSLFVQVSNFESVAGFRRDTTNARKIHIVKYKFAGKTAVKQYKTGSYFFHLITTSDGWMAGTGGADNPTINRAIEKLAGKMAKSGKIGKSDLKKIQKYERRLGIGHFSIKAPNGKYALVWKSGIFKGKLKAGEYLSVPNGLSYFRHGNWEKFSKDPANAAIKIAATDGFGINRRDATAFHWKATTVDGKTNSTIKVYAANDNGKLVGRSTGHLKDNIVFKGKFISKDKLPNTPSSKFLGTFKMGSLDKLIKTQTTVKVPKMTGKFNESAKFNITVKDKKTNKAVKDLKLKVKINKTVYTIKTDSKGVARFDTKSLAVGKYEVLIYSGSMKYYVSGKSTIIIK
jgi:hypothetical protein